MEYAYIKPIIYFCNKILPAVYDESLSYYEALCKMRDKLNEVIDNVNNVNQHIDDVINQALSDEHLMELFSVFIANIEAAISANNEGNNTNSSKGYNIGEMLWLDDKLYKAIRSIDAGDTFIVDTNIEIVTFEQLFNNFTTDIKEVITPNDESGNIVASQNWNTGDWIWFDNELYIVCKNIAEGNAFIYSGTNTNVKKTNLEDLSEVVYYPNDKRLTIHGKVSDYSQIVTRGDYHIYTPNIETITIEHTE